MLSPWLDVDNVADRVRWACAITGIDLIDIGTNGDDDAVRDTAHAQPLLTALALAVAGSIMSPDARPGVSTGHSVGEYAAAVVAGALTAETALVLVRERGRLMAADSARNETGMAAVLGGETSDVLDAIECHGLHAANINGAGQIVAAGTRDALDTFADNPPPGARVRPLAVSGAFHTPFMDNARAALAELADEAPHRDPVLTLLSNADGAVVNDGRDVLRRLVTQVVAPVRWDLCMQTMADLGVTVVIELPPAGALTGLVRRSMPDVETLAIRTPDDLPAARTLVERHASVSHESAPSWRLAVAPVAGTFRAAPVTAGTSVAAGTSVGTVVANRTEASVAAAHGGVLVEWLVHDGDPVSPGQPIALLHPEPVFA